MIQKGVEKCFFTQEIKASFEIFCGRNFCDFYPYSKKFIPQKKFKIDQSQKFLPHNFVKIDQSQKFLPQNFSNDAI